MTNKIKPDLSEFKAFSKRQSGCSLGVKIKKLIDQNPQQAANLEAALEDETIPHAHIMLVMRDWGYRVDSKSISRHRKKVCTCDI